MDRERVGREASPSAAIIDSQSVKTTESGGPRGYDAGMTIKGPRSRCCRPSPGGVARDLSFIERLFADGGYAGERLSRATPITVEIVRRIAEQVGFVVLPQRSSRGSTATDASPMT